MKFGLVVQVLCTVLFLSACSTTSRAPVVNGRTNDARHSPVVSKHTPPSAYDPAAATRGYHVVATGDTLYSIAWRYGFDYRNLARWNNISSPYVIYPKQVIRLKPQTGPATKQPQTKPSASQKQATRKTTEKNTTTVSKRPTKRIVLNWQWPTRGSIIKSDAPTSKKGIDISGKLGQSITAAASGEVVYSGSGLLGYGKLIIIKHNDTFLSAYAHNEKILVKEGDKVTTGDKIATMGIGNNGKPILHFEIRQDGQPVSPLNHLPKQRS